jgi:aminoglycoside phosphotransferase family enzyme/predicted kinase
MPDGTKPPGSAGLVERLRSPECYAHAAGEVELLETHISWVLLAGEYAYKIKKPVSLGFVDFSTLAMRRFYCEEELRLNVRTAPGIYLEVVPVTGTPERPVMGGEGEAFEYAVKMRRFPQEALLDRVAKAGLLDAALVEAFARSVAQFHANVARAGGDGAFGSPAAVLAEAVDNFAQLELLDALDGTRADRQWLASWTLREFNRLQTHFARRKREGFVRECHGDLHLGNVALLEGAPVPFDAIEFNESFRWIDVMNEVAFPAMDLFHHGLASLAYRFLDAYLDATGDFGGLRLLRFYVVYRAMVRAKVSCIRAHQPGVDGQDRERSASAYRGHLELARRLARPPVPALVVMHGLSGSGKTTVSQALVESLGGVRLRSDVERKRLHGLPAAAHTGSAPGEGLYTPQADRTTYGRLSALAGEVLDAGWPAIVDAAFLKRAWREMFREFARERGVPFVLVACAAPEEVLRERVARREREGHDASEAGLAILERQFAAIEPLAADELDSAVIVGAKDIGEAMEEVVNNLVIRLGAGVDERGEALEFVGHDDRIGGRRDRGSAGAGERARVIHGAGAPRGGRPGG